MFQPRTFAVTGVFVTSSLSVQEILRSFEFIMKQGTTSSPDDCCEKSYLRGKTSTRLHYLVYRKGKATLR